MIRLAGYGRISAALSIVTAASIAVAVLGLPALAGAQAGRDPVITVTAGGDRTGDTSVAGLAGVTFDFYAGVMHSEKQGGLANGAVLTCANASISATCSAVGGINKISNVDVAAGLRYQF